MLCRVATNPVLDSHTDVEMALIRCRPILIIQIDNWIISRPALCNIHSMYWWKVHVRWTLNCFRCNWTREVGCKEALSLMNHLNWFSNITLNFKTSRGAVKISVWNYHCISQWHKNNTNLCTSTVNIMNLLIQALPLHSKRPALSNNTTSAPSGRVQSKAILLNGRNSLLRKDKYSAIHTGADFRCSRWNMSPWDAGMRQERAT